MTRSTSPTLWRVVHCHVGAVDGLLLGDGPDDSFRVSLSIVGNGDRAPDVEAHVVYPCAVCGWEFSCGLDGCHA